jgi:hypothetical protein
VSLKREWLGILDASPYFQQYATPLRDHLAEYPRRPAAGARDILYWVNEKYSGLKPVVSVVHAVIYQDPTKADRTVVAQKQLYASHYYDGSLAIASATAALDGSVPVTYLVYANRSRGDLLKGGFGGLKRKVAGDQAKTAAEQTLRTIKTRPPGSVCRSPGAETLHLPQHRRSGSDRSRRRSIGRSDCRTEAGDGFSLVLERLEDRRELRNDEKILQPLRRVQQFQRAALTLGSGVGSNQLT